VDSRRTGARRTRLVLTRRRWANGRRSGVDSRRTRARRTRLVPSRRWAGWTDRWRSGANRRQALAGKTKRLLLEQLPGHTFPQNSEGSFGDDFSNGASDCLGHSTFRSTHVNFCTLQQTGKQLSLGHAENAFIAQQGARETIDHLSCGH
jgi:hypothetical protein